MALTLTIIVFVTVAAVIFFFGAAIGSPSSTLGQRLRSLASQQQAQPQRPAIKERIEQALDPLSKAIPMSPSEATKSRAWLMQAGFREERHQTFYFGIRVPFALHGLAIVLATGVGLTSPPLLIGIPALGFLLPRFIL